MSRSRRIRPRCFNPCCIGLGIQTDIDTRPNCWAVSSFNPCCIGLGIQTPDLPLLRDCRQYVSILVVLDWVFKLGSCRTQQTAYCRFQSLLYWIGYSNGLARLCASAFVCRFQSLLYWIGYSNAIATIVTITPEERFQSLLYWIGYSNPQGFTIRRNGYRVSILVVLDWVFKPHFA